MGGFKNLAIALVMLNLAAGAMLYFGRAAEAPDEGKFFGITRKEDLATLTIEMTPSKTKIRIKQEFKGGQVSFEMEEPLRVRCTGESLNGIATALYWLDKKYKVAKEKRGPDAQYGLDKPEMILEFTELMSKAKHVLKVGGQDELSGARFYKVDADENVYLMAREAYDSFTRAPEKYEDLSMGEFHPPFVFKIEGDRQILVDGRPARERMVVEPVPDTSIWFIREPEIIAGQPAALEMLGMLMQSMSELRALEFVADSGNPKDYGMDDPELVLTFHMKQGTGALKPRTYTFGKVERAVPDKPETKETIVYLKGDFRERIARIDENVLNALLGGRGFNAWRYPYLYDFQPTELQALNITVPDVGEFEIVRLPKAEEQLFGKWKVVKPADLKYNELELDAWVSDRFMREGVITEFGEPGSTVSPIGVKPTVVTVVFKRPIDGPQPVKRYYTMWIDPTTKIGHALKEGLNQPLEVQEDYIYNVERMYLNIMQRVAHRLERRSDLLTVKVDLVERVGASQTPYPWGYAFVQKPNGSAAWDGAAPPAHVFTLEKCERILDLLNDLPALTFVTQRAGQEALFGLDKPLITVTLGIDTNHAGDVDKTEVLRISSARADRGGKIYGMIESQRIIFELRPDIHTFFK